MLRYIFYLFLFISALHAEDKDPYAKEGVAWQTFQKFRKAVIAQDIKGMKELLSGKMVKEFPIDQVGRIAEEFQRRDILFVREFEGKNKKFRYLVLNSGGQNGCLVFKKGEKGLTLDDSLEQDLKGPDDKINPKNRVRVKVNLARVKSRLKQIAVTYAMYFADGTSTKIPSPEVADVDSTIMNYTHPETGEIGEFLFVQPGYNYSGDSGLVLATTDKPILGSYQAVFEDGHVESITIEEFKQHRIILGLTSEKVIYKELDLELQKEILSLIDQLGAEKYKERKAAKKALLKKGKEIVGFLNKHKNNSDFEVKVSIGEIIKQLSVKSPTGKRPIIR